MQLCLGLNWRKPSCNDNVLAPLPPPPLRMHHLLQESAPSTSTRAAVVPLPRPRHPLWSKRADTLPPPALPGTRTRMLCGASGLASPGTLSTLTSTSQSGWSPSSPSTRPAQINKTSTTHTHARACWPACVVQYLAHVRPLYNPRQPPQVACNLDEERCWCAQRLPQAHHLARGGSPSPCNAALCECANVPLLPAC